MPKSAVIRIGLVFDVDTAYPRGVLRGIKQFAQTRPDWILVFHQAEGLKSQTLEIIDPAGLICNVVSRPLLELVAGASRPVVNVSPVLPEAGLPRVMVDHRQVGRIAFQHLRDGGLTHFGFVGHPRHLYSIEREAGFRERLDPSGYSFAAYYERSTISFRHRARLLALSAGLQRWLRNLPKPVGVFTCHDVWGMQVIEACRLIGLRVPDDVAVIGVDNDDLLCELARPALSSVIVPAERIGFEAALMLHRILRTRRMPPAHGLIPTPGIVPRSSTDVLAGGDADLVAAVRFIRQNGNRALRVDDVLRVVPASRRALEQKFRGVLQRGIAEEIRRVHIERAKALLVTTALSVAEVAEQSGFSSVFHLSSVFRAQTGDTPTGFRRRHRAVGPPGTHPAPAVAKAASKRH
ncbi:MAG: substrate-binding domain-containing protein [Planctomycetaceae bacterium]